MYFADSMHVDRQGRPYMVSLARSQSLFRVFGATTSSLIRFLVRLPAMGIEAALTWTECDGCVDLGMSGSRHGTADGCISAGFFVGLRPLRPSDRRSGE